MGTESPRQSNFRCNKICVIDIFLISFESHDLSFLKVTVHLEWCFQFLVCNFVITHRLPKNLYINGKLMKLSR